MARPRHDNRRTRGGWRTSDRLAASSRLERWKAESVPVIFKGQNIPSLPHKLFSPGEKNGSYLTVHCRGISSVPCFAWLPWYSIVSNCSLWSVGLWVSVSLLKCRRNISKLQCSMKFLFKFEMERAALKGTKPFTNWWVLAHEPRAGPPSHTSQWERKCLESSSLTYTVVVMSRPARERHILKWILASWKRLPRRDTVH